MRSESARSALVSGRCKPEGDMEPIEVVIDCCDPECEQETHLVTLFPSYRPGWFQLNLDGVKQAHRPLDGLDAEWIAEVRRHAKPRPRKD